MQKLASRRSAMSFFILAALRVTIFAQIEPVDGRLKFWNHDWDRLEHTPAKPRGRVMLSIMIYTPFSTTKFVSLSEDKEGVIVAYLAESAPRTFEPGASNAPSVVTCVSSFPRDLAQSLRSIWVSALYKSHYQEGSGDALLVDGSRCFLGASDELHSGRYMMGYLYSQESPCLKSFGDLGASLADYIKASKSEHKTQCETRIRSLEKDLETNISNLVSPYSTGQSKSPSKAP